MHSFFSSASGCLSAASRQGLSLAPWVAIPAGALGWILFAVVAVSPVHAQDDQGFSQGTDGPPDYTLGEEDGTDPIPADEPRSWDEAEPGEVVVKPTENNTGIGIEELVVTAQKRAQDIQDVPISVAALNAQFIEDAGLTDVLGLSQYVPNLQINENTDTRSTGIRIRGIGSDGINAGIDPSVGVFIDGVYIGRSGASAITDMIDIERIEVLRGPQGTLYGKNTAAGAISVVSKKPIANVFEGALEGWIGSYGDRQFRGSVNIPLLDDRIAARISGYWVDRDPYDIILSTGQGVNDGHRSGARGSLLFNITDDLELMVRGDYNAQGNRCCVADILTYEGYPNLDVVFSEDFAAPIDGLGSLEGANNRPLPEADGFDRIVDADQPVFNDVETWGVSGEFNYDIGEYVVTWLNAYRQYSSFSTLDGDFSSFDAVVSDTKEDFEQVSSELRLTSPAGETIDYVAGLFFYYSRDNTLGHTGIGPDWFAASDSLRGLFLGPTSEPDENGRIVNTDTNEHRTWSYAFFGQGTWHATEWFDLTLGLRGTYEEKARAGSQISGFKLVDAGPFGPDRFLDERFSVFNLSPMGALQFYPTDDIMLFTRAARGFKSGGFNQLRTIGGDNTRFNDEIATDVDAGIRTTWFDRMLTLNGTFYYIWYDDFQSQAFDGSGFSVTNAGSLTSYGFEADTMFVPHPILVTGASVGYNIARYGDFTSAPCTAEQGFAEREKNGNLASPTGCLQDLSGRPLDNAPEWTVSTYAQLNLPLGQLPRIGGMLGFLRAEYSYRSQFYLSQDLDENLIQQPVNLVNVRAGIRAEDDRWDITLWAQNLANESYSVVGFDVPIVSGYAAVNGPPRTWGATLRYRWF